MNWWSLRQLQWIPGPSLSEAGLQCFESSSKTMANVHLPLGLLLGLLSVGSLEGLPALSTLCIPVHVPVLT